MASEPEYSKIIQAIAQDIEALKAEFPQLKLFSSSSPICVYHEGLTISYGYKTHQPQRRAGWRGGVPEPNADGIWFYIGIYDHNSPHQIDSQPAFIDPLCIGEKGVTFLILEGKKTKSITKQIDLILRKHGVKSCAELHPDSKS